MDLRLLKTVLCLLILLYLGLRLGAILIIVISASMLVIIPIIGVSSLSLSVDELPSKPENHFMITEVDPTFLKAISSGKYLDFDYIDETKD